MRAMHLRNTIDTPEQVHAIRSCSESVQYRSPSRRPVWPSSPCSL